MARFAPADTKLLAVQSELLYLGIGVEAGSGRSVEERDEDAAPLG